MPAYSYLGVLAIIVQLGGYLQNQISRKERILQYCNTCASHPQFQVIIKVGGELCGVMRNVKDSKETKEDNICSKEAEHTAL